MSPLVQATIPTPKRPMMQQPRPDHLFDLFSQQRPGEPLRNPADIYNAVAAGPPIGRYREMTIDELLLENRVIFLVGEINYSSATGVIMRLLYLQNQKKGVDINLYINSPGGAVDDTLAIYDTMQFLDCEINTYCIGKAMSGGAIVLAAGSKGKRFSLPHAKVMIHQPYGGIYGQTTDVQIQAEEIIKTKRQLNEILARHTGQTVDRIEEDSERDRFFSAHEAKEYGLVDEVIARTAETATK
jgi:ATP-dependent Clp protease protease subunit